MHIKFLNHGKGSAARAAAYLLDDKDHQNLDRSDVSVLRGDPYQFAAIAAIAAMVRLRIRIGFLR